MMYSMPLTLLIMMSAGQDPTQDHDTAEAPAAAMNWDDSKVRARLLELMQRGIETREPNHSLYPWRQEVEHESLFTGSYDWHSCVIAHWCLLVAARTGSDRELEAWVMERLSEEGLAREMKVLMGRDVSRPRTFPYDEAWFLMLLRELGERPEPPAELESWRWQLEDHLLDWLEESPFPERAERGFSGAYDSWLMAYLLVIWSEPAREGARSRLHALNEERLAPQRDAIAKLSKTRGYDFLWLPALAALVDRCLDGEASAYDPGTPPELPDEVVVATVHPLGVAISRTWPDAFDAGAGAAPAKARFHEHLSHFLAREDLWDGEFDACTHWLPQYLWIGLWLADGRP